MSPSTREAGAATPAPSNSSAATAADPEHGSNDRIILMAAALSYGAAGWAVFPCNGKGTYKGSHGFHDATTDPDQIIRWWNARPRSNIGAPPPTTLAVIDFDAKAGGLETLRQFEETLGVPVTLTTHTGGGGLHLWFLHPGGELRQGVGVLGPGVDTRMPGRGYVVLPPSVHPKTGVMYEWHDPEVSPVAMPKWMADRLREPKPPAMRPITITVNDAYTRAALEGELARVAAALEGSRNETLFLAACNLGTLVGARMLDQQAATSHLINAGLALGLGDREVVATVASGIGWGADHPRQLKAG
ncbi:hypothetical protein BH18ACT6_BH18ACT6_07590 [soil metagenome]